MGGQEWGERALLAGGFGLAEGQACVAGQVGVGLPAHVVEGGPGPTPIPSFPPGSGPASSSLAMELPKNDTLGSDQQPFTQPGAGSSGSKPH